MDISERIGTVLDLLPPDSYPMQEKTQGYSER